MSGITSHVLDTSLGKPAAGIAVRLERRVGDANEDQWREIGNGETNNDGRVSDLAFNSMEAGHYRISFSVSDYFQQRRIQSFYPIVRIEFQIDDANQHYHVPLLLNPFGYSTYRGS